MSVMFVSLYLTPYYFTIEVGNLWSHTATPQYILMTWCLSNRHLQGMVLSSAQGHY